MINTIVFEMDDILFSQKEYVLSGLREVDKLVIRRYSVDGFYQVASELYDDGERKQLIKKALDNLNIRYDEKMVHFLTKKYYEHVPTIQLFQDAKWVLNHLARDVKLGIISDGILDAQYNKVKALGLNSKFQSIILCDRFGRENWKPSILPYKHLCMALETEHHECCFVGNNPNTDFITANKLGWETVHLDRMSTYFSEQNQSYEYNAKYKIQHLRELANIPGLKHLFTNRYVPI
ncbi:HAD family hydrolase [Metabacillus malikii]|uniref:Hydrolase of the HAD superfamily n=1 Tax=Metabacillus malikii TaxID=1504265 RepID=A0ABT9ZI41_9BACI|nr:HAD family hydrolase [Metabacillus malikii]MDQ0231955.1 putative hydrolase of the HAD superfamily [Metabacillus malikii]